ncbi:hypothetical protein BLNAU_5390 [Blattamonas nauphoetae]|uniref:Uncharacterized protein n=1 Tax=Blattamonas nauphoetae TaxID=2049346 RepID=A0ABQ9Y768_9EUKA|nr:hypothetical protein BLNAU_5390 [Blattamonas nauphoetae]
MTKFQTMHDYLTTVQIRGGEAERKSEIARFMLTVKQALAHCWASSVSMSEAELMEGCADVGDVCTQFESC